MTHFLRFLRIWLPALVVLAGVLVIVIRRDDNGLDGGAGIIGAGLSIWLMNFLWRIGVRGDVDRDEEAAARAFYDEWGHWPDEPGPGHRVAAADADPAGGGEAEPHDAPHRHPVGAAAHRRAAPRPRRPGG